MAPGLIYMFGGSVAPSGFLICDGSSISRSTYADLFSAIGTTYGAGDGSTTFNLPDMSGRVPIGVSLDIALGDVGGEETHTLLTNELPSHSHGIPSHGHTNSIKATTPQLTHSITQPMFTYNPTTGSRSSSTSSSKNWTTSNTTTAASRSANLAIANHTASSCTKTGTVTDCNAFDMESVGGDAAHSNMQPYITLNYIISTGE